jgi:hypothetical protein
MLAALRKSATLANGRDRLAYIPWSAAIFSGAFTSRKITVSGSGAGRVEGNANGVAASRALSASTNAL